MNSRLAELSRRRAELTQRAEDQRAQLAYYYQQFDRPVRMVESGLRLVSTFSRSPWVVTGLAIALLKTPWRKLARWPKLLWRGWSIYRLVRAWAI